ncbi:MAG: Asp23/Gls24 family envelope stress response protein [Actinomycetota bacterium]|nr:Asp23/Gls24 family envelope stress response protein [Actinomycetota bacterium]
MEKEDDGDVSGKITISDEVVADVAGLTCNRCYGVVGMAGQSFQEGVAELLGRDSLRKGVRLKRKGDAVSFSLFVIVEAGININEVAHNLVEQVKYMVENCTGLQVEEVQVHVQGVRAP